jgi:hypothetical protein
VGRHGYHLGGLYRYWLPDALDAQGVIVLNALVSLNLFDAANSIGGRGQVNPFSIAAREAREAQANTGLLGVRPLCGGLDDTRPNGAACGYAGLVG